MRFSVIVPVYKVEDYIRQCVDSILMQDFTDYEAILVDDGSPDNCGKICDEYAAHYPQIVAVHKRNGGLSDARNYGMQRARGEYIIFLDGDDWIAAGCLREFDQVIGADHPDVLETTLIEAFDEWQDFKDRNFDDYLQTRFTADRAVNWCCNISQNAWPAQKKICARTFIRANHLEFLKGRVHEDVDWTAKVMYAAVSYKGCAFPWYYHRMGREGSITNRITLKNIIDTIEIAAIHYQIYIGKRDDVHRKVFYRMMKSVYPKIALACGLSADEQKIAAHYISCNYEIFKIAPLARHKVFYWAMRMLGIKNAIKVLGIVQRKRIVV